MRAAAATMAPRRMPRIDAPRMVYMLLFVLVGIFVLYPVLVILMESFLAGPIAQPQEWSLAWWRAALSEPAMLGAAWNTLKIVFFVELIAMPVAVLLAWVLARTDLPGRRSLEFLFWITFFLPSLSVTLGWIVLLDPQIGLLNQLAMSLPFVHAPPFNIYSFWGIVWVHLSTHSVAVKVLVLTPAFRNLDAYFEEAARISGANRWQTLRMVVVPVAAPAILTVLVLSVIRAIQTFEIEMVLGPPFHFWVLGTRIYRLVNQVPPEFGVAAALSAMNFLFILPLIVCHRWLLTRKDYASVSGRIRTSATPLGRWRIPLVVAICLFCFAITLLPVAFLVAASFMKLFGFFHISEPWTWANWQRVFDDDFFGKSLLNTLKMAGSAAIVSVLLCSLIAYFTVRSRYPGRGVLDFLSWLPFAIPGILLSVGFLYVILGNPVLQILYGSIPVLVLATVVAHMTFGVQILKASMLQLGAGLEEAARTSGATWWFTFRTVIVPILMPTLVLVGMINFIGATRDISSVALLASNDTKTISLLQLDYMIDGRSETAAVLSVVVIALTTGIAFLARFMGLKVGVHAQDAKASPRKNAIAGDG